MLFEILSIVWSALCDMGSVIAASVQPEWSMLTEMNAISCLLVSAFCGALVGIEREHASKPAGLRTNMFICVGSALFTLASLASWKYIAGGVPTVDPGRIAAQIVTGVGFLGAGVILKTKAGDIIGIATASTIWLVSAIGMVIGFGFPILGVLVAVTTTVSLFILGRIELTSWFSPKQDDSQDEQ